MTKKTKTPKDAEGKSAIRQDVHDAVAQDAANAKKDKKGHNSKPGKNPALIKIFTDVEKLQGDLREIGKVIRSLKNDAKKSHNISTTAFNRELSNRKMQDEVRQALEHEMADLQSMLGYQFALDLQTSAADIPAEDDAVEAGKKEKADSSKKKTLRAVA